MNRKETRAVLRACLVKAANTSDKDSDLYCRRGGGESQLTTLLDATLRDGRQYHVVVTATMRLVTPQEKST